MDKYCFLILRIIPSNKDKRVHLLFSIERNDFRESQTELKHILCGVSAPVTTISELKCANSLYRLKKNSK